MTRKEALQILSNRDRVGINIINANDLETIKYNQDSVEALRKAIVALEREQKFLEAGYKNEEVEFYIGGRKFVVREVAQ